MDKILSFNEFNNNQSFEIPAILFNKEKSCLKIDEYYIFLNEKITIKHGEDKLNELFGLDWNDFIPNTTSEWIHLGVDAASGILDAIPSGVTQIASFIIDLLHAGSYFIEAEYSDDSERFGLRLAGVITAIFAFIPGFGNVGGAATKKLLKGVGNTVVAKGVKKGANLISNNVVARLIKKLLSIPGMGVKGVKTLFKSLFNIPSLKVKMFKVISKMEDSWLFSQMLKVPFVKKVVNFIKRDIDKVLLKTQKAFTKEFDTFQKAIKNTTRESIKEVYKSSDKAVKGGTICFNFH